MQQNVQKSRITILPRRSARVTVSPPVLSQPRPTSSEARTRALVRGTERVGEEAFCDVMASIVVPRPAGHDMPRRKAGAAGRGGSGHRGRPAGRTSLPESAAVSPRAAPRPGSPRPSG